ncbi:MAG: hypothetical protein H7A21_17365 [Spirochaetales bacterium]|nr:hypothetical protein [Leptospiraceae bacterium]MCP5483211.1 hypothetical protein [Spirochaetales bacterium]MCP5486715.1 hypothetical protein [Spirochaetales bacterium]
MPVETDEIEERMAAVFDFDGLVYQAQSQWKVRNARLGVLGSRVLWKDAFVLYEDLIQRFPDLRITDCFTLDEYGYDRVTPGPDLPNITPPDSIMKTAQNHVFRGHDLLLLSRSTHRDLLVITEHLMGEPRFPVLKNPFEQARFLTPAEDRLPILKDHGVDLKFALLSSLVRRNEDLQANAGQEDRDARSRYNKIFLYHTERSYVERVERFVRENLDSLTDGRNAIVPSYIAELIQ